MEGTTMSHEEKSKEQIAVEANGNLPLTQKLRTRHPDTGELIDEVKDWQDKHGNWLPTEYNKDTKAYQVKVKKSTEESEG